MELSKLISQFDITPAEAVTFFNDNDWFDMKPEFKDGTVELNDEQAALFSEKLTTYLEKATAEDLFSILQEKYPATAKVLADFFKKAEVPKETQFFLLDFLLVRLTKDIMLYSDLDIEELLDYAALDLIIDHSMQLVFFLAYVRTKRKTKYRKDYGVQSRKMENNNAYTFYEFIEMLYPLYNAEYIEEHEMYKKAAQSKNYADTWLFLAIHFICVLRMTDLERIYHPRLPKDPATVLAEIENGTFSDNDARKVLLSITDRLNILPLRPNKTSDSEYVPDIKFVIPDKCEVHIGTLFALAEAHQQILGETGPIIRKIATYEEITRYMGEEMGNIFIKCNFRCRKANKSYLQLFENMANEMYSVNNLQVRGYILASLARSHKGGYGKFASTTATYLQDAAMSGLTPDFVSLELTERGVLSCISSMCLTIATGGAYKQLSVSNQTELIKALGLKNTEIEGIVALFNQSLRRAQKAVFQAVSEDMPILEILHNIGNGSAYSKQPDCLCLLTAVHQSCPYSHDQCIGCQYEISTKATLVHMVTEYKRIAAKYKATESSLEKMRCKTVITDVIVPKLNEMLVQVRDIYGEKVYNEYCELMNEYLEGDADGK